MKKTVTLALSALLALALLVGCTAPTQSQTPGSADTSLGDATPNMPATAADTGNHSDEMKLPYAIDLSPEDGADQVEREGDHVASPYFAHPDVYNMESSDTLTILPKFQTMQQTSEWACGVTSALLVLNWYGALGEWNEETLAALRHPLVEGDLAGYPGTTLKQALEIFDGVGGFTYTSTLDFADPWSEITLDTFRDYLDEGIPVMICWNDWGGHWQVIVGYDDMGTETYQDDVFLVADPYDTTDHNQDGYGVYSAERLYYNFSMYNTFPESEGGNDLLFLAAKPVA